VLFNGALGTPTSGTVTNLTGTASININGTVGATTRSTVAATTVNANSGITLSNASNPLLSVQDTTATTGPSVFVQAASTIGSGEGLFGTTSNHPLGFYVNAVKYASLTTTGLAVTGALSATGIVTAGDYFNSTAADNGYRISGTTIIGGNGTNLFIKGATSVNFQVPNGTTVGTFSSTGLAVTGALSATGDVGIGAAPNAGFALDITRSGVDVKQRMANSSSGNVQIGMTTVGQQDWAFGVDRSDSGKFKIAASGAVASSTAITLTASGAVRFNTYGAGALTTDASGNITAASDERIKKNIRPFSRGLAEILAINPILHGYTEESGLDQTRDDYAGFSAQQVQSLIPEAIGENADGMLSFSDRPVMAALVNAMKELNANLVAQVAALSQRLAALEAK
jgi:hypothetical protein